MKSNFYSRGRLMLFALVFLASFSHQKLQAQQFLTTIDGWNAYVHLPAEYNDSITKRYPVIIFLPGIGELGTNAAKLLVNGPSKFIASGHNMEFMVNGKLEKPIVISLQPRDPWPPSAAVLNRRIDSIVARWRCDLQRISGTGLSAGASSWGTYVSAGVSSMTNRLASMAVMSGGVPQTGISSIKNYINNGGTWWGFEGTTDPLQMDALRDTCNYYKAASARYYRYTGGHCCWNTYYNPAWNENGESIYTWMLKQVRPSGTNVEPQSFAGKDTVLPTILTSYTLKGAGNDPNGNAISFNWRKIAGPAAGTISTPAAAQTAVTGLAMGIYRFELSVTDALGAVAKDTVEIHDGMAALPLNLLDFTAGEQGNHVLLQWATSSEINTSHFEIEKLGDANLYLKTGAMAAKAIAQPVNKYQYSDYGATPGLNYYRLKIVDKDGQFTYSRIITVNVKSSNNPAVEIVSMRANGDAMNVKLTSREEGPATILVADMQGRILSSNKVVLTKGLNQFNQNISLQRAAYVVKVAKDESQFTGRFIKE